MKQPVLSPEERTVVQHFESSQTRDSHGRSIVPLLRKSGVKALEESRTQPEERHNKLKRLLRKKGTFQEFTEVLGEYLPMKDLRPKSAEKTLCDATSKPIITSIVRAT